MILSRVKPISIAVDRKGRKLPVIVVLSFQCISEYDFIVRIAHCEMREKKNTFRSGIQTFFF